jgi:hypothetical protein
VTRRPEGQPPRLNAKEIPGSASQGATEFPEGLERRVLAGALQPVEGWTANAQSAGHCRLREPGLLPKVLE